MYRQRFGIETSSRQQHQAQAWTTSKERVYRLLLEGIAYRVRQVGVVLTEQLARQRPARARAWFEELSRAVLLEWSGDHLEAL